MLSRTNRHSLEMIVSIFLSRRDIWTRLTLGSMDWAETETEMDASKAERERMESMMPADTLYKQAVIRY